MKIKEFSTEIGGKKLICQFTDLADQTNGSVIVRYGNTIILVTAVMSKNKREDIDYFPLSVDYEEKFYAAGQILGSRFMKREGRPSDEAILSGRIIDRTIRPLFDASLRNEVQVVVTVLSLENYDPDVLGVIGASLALATSDIPWNGPVSGLRIGRKKSTNEFILNPDFAFLEDPDFLMEMVVCGKDGNINMIEVGSNEGDEKLMAESLHLASTELEKIQDFQRKIISEIGKEKKEVSKIEISDDAKKLFQEKIIPEMEEAVFSGPGNANIYTLMDKWTDEAADKYPEEKMALAKAYFEEKVNEILHIEAIKNEKRADGRKLNEVRPLVCQAGGISPILHGSGIFYRGGTHVFSALTLGGPQDAQIIDGMEVQIKKRFMHHYNFPPFSSGETGRMSGTNRRMIGHGALAEKALLAVIPPKEQFPYTIRLVSESMASNGSTSMASVCGSTLALMDGGVPIKNPVAGIAMGLMMSSNFKDDGKYKILTDIQGPEDHHGDMDFKVAGTKEGITAIQLDIKVDGVPVPILEEALEQAREARIKILSKMAEAIGAPRPEISPNAPKIVVIQIKPTQIGMVIGSGGKTVNEIREETETEIEIEDDGTVFITGKADGPEKARAKIEEITKEWVRGDKASGAVVKITDFGAFVKIGYNTEGLVHISEIGNFRIEKVSDVLKEGDEVPVVVKDVDERGRISLSIKLADSEFARKKVPATYPGLSGNGNSNGKNDSRRNTRE